MGFFLQGLTVPWFAGLCWRVLWAEEPWWVMVIGFRGPTQLKWLSMHVYVLIDLPMSWLVWLLYPYSPRGKEEQETFLWKRFGSLERWSNFPWASCQGCPCTVS